MKCRQSKFVSPWSW